jgi:hypothetical protein
MHLTERNSPPGGPPSLVPRGSAACKTGCSEGPHTGASTHNAEPRMAVGSRARASHFVRGLQTERDVDRVGRPATATVRVARPQPPRAAAHRLHAHQRAPPARHTALWRPCVPTGATSRRGVPAGPRTSSKPQFAHSAPRTGAGQVPGRPSVHELSRRAAPGDTRQWPPRPVLPRDR